jgi:SAM-dependent methyltransferase
MERLKDVSEWYTPERVEADEVLGAATTSGGYYDYAAWIEKVCHEHKLKTVIEVGCGAGWVPSVLSKGIQYMTGIDSNEHMLAKARARCPNVNFVQQNIRHLKAPSADLVCCFGVLKHFHLDEWHKILAAVLSLGKYGLFCQHVLMDARASVDVPGCDEQGVPQYHDIWVCYTDLDQAIADAGHQIIKFDDTFRYDAAMQAPEAMIVTKHVEAPPAPKPAKKPGRPRKKS